MKLNNTIVLKISCITICCALVSITAWVMMRGGLRESNGRENETQLVKVDIIYDRAVISGEIVDLPIELATGFGSEAKLVNVQLTCGCTSLWIDEQKYEATGILVRPKPRVRLLIDTDGKRNGQNEFGIVLSFQRNGRLKHVYVNVTIPTLAGLTIVQQDFQIGENRKGSTFIYTDVPEKIVGLLTVEVSDPALVEAAIDSSPQSLITVQDSPVGGFRLAGKVEFMLKSNHSEKKHFWVRVKSDNQNIKPVEIAIRRENLLGDRLRQLTSKVILTGGKAAQVIFLRNQQQMDLKLEVVESSDDLEVVIDDHENELVVTVSGLQKSESESTVRLKDSNGEIYELAVILMQDE